MAFIYPVAFFDAPQILDASVTSIPGSGSSPIQVIADLPTAVHAIDYIDGIGKYVGVYVGPPGQEVLKCIIGGGVNSRAWAVFPIHSRISVRAMTPTAISAGTLFCAFLGYQAGI